jgi:acetyl-CoA acetyltransferase
MKVGWSLTTFQGPAQMGPVISAILAVAAGLCRHALVYRTVTESTGQGQGRRRGQQADADDIEAPYDWLFPIGAVSPANWMAFYATRYMSEFGLTRRQLGWLPVVQRAHAALNERAVLQQPMSIDDYLSARMITSPFCLYDCDIPVDGSTAFVISAADTQSDLRAPVQIEAMGCALRGRPLWEQWEDMTTSVTHSSAAQMWNRTDLCAADVDVALLYDGFSIIPVLWLEALGFCGRGEVGEFIEGGSRIRLGGDLPVNPHGGQLSEGRLHGFGVLAEAVTQVRHEAGSRQVASADISVATMGGGVMGGSILLSRMS